MNNDTYFLEKFASICAEIALKKQYIGKNFNKEVDQELERLPPSEQAAMRRAIKYYLMMHQTETYSAHSMQHHQI